MVYGVSGQEPSQPPSLSAAEAQGPPVDPWAGASPDPWAAAAPPGQQQQQQAPSQQQQQQQQAEADAWTLDAFGKGKDKGAGPQGPLACWNCLGEGHPSFLCPAAKGAGKAGSGPTCGNCRGKGHDATACTSKGGGKHTPKGGKGGGGKPNFFGGKGGKGGGKGKGKGYGKGGRISEFDDAGWAHVGAAPEWNLASGSEWAAAEATSQWPPAASLWPPASADAAPPPWAGGDTAALLDSEHRRVAFSQRLCSVWFHPEHDRPCLWIRRILCESPGCHTQSLHALGRPGPRAQP